MTDHDRNQLLGDILGGDELNRVRQATLQRGLREMRRRRQRAMLGRVSMMALPPLLLAVAVFYPSFKQVRPASERVVISHASAAAPKVEYINKEQLFALFPNRPMALLGKPGHQQVIFLDGGPAISQQ